MDYKDYYKIMGVARGAEQAEIKRAYRKLAKKYHPDVSKEKNAEEKFKEMQEAYDVLGTPDKRAAYDKLGSNWKSGQEFRPPPDWGQDFDFRAHDFGGERGGGGTGGRRTGPGGQGYSSPDDGSFSDFFSALFGARNGAGGGRGPSVGAAQDHVAKIQVPLEDVYRGGAQTIELKSPEVTANGQVINKPRTLKVTIPAGMVEGQQIRLAGQGSPGVGGGPAGDLYLEISFAPHPSFATEGRNVSLTLPIAPWEAALGAKIQVPTLGGPVEMNIPAGARAGQRLRLRGRGLPGASAGGLPAGDQYVTLQIVTPLADTPKARAFYEQMRSELAFNPRAELEAV